MPLRSAWTLESGSTRGNGRRQCEDPGRTSAWAFVLAAAVLSALLVSPGRALAADSTAGGTAARPSSVVSLPLPENERCLECHGEKSLSAGQGGATVSLYVDPTAYNDSRHGVIACVSCHEAVQAQSAEEHKTAAAALPAGRALRIAISRNCGKCHAGKTLATYQQSFHWAGLNLGGTSTASCADCHDAHQALPASDARSTVAQANLPTTCGQQGCHPGADKALAAAPVHTSPQAQGPWSPARLIWKAFIILILFDTMKDGPIVLFELIRRLRPNAAGHSASSASQEVDSGV